MREILFRGKRADNGEWAYGYFTKSPSQKTYITETVAGCASPKVVIPETVGQYIGLTDKNNVKVFGGDICKVNLNPEICTGKVVWDDKVASYIILFAGNKQCVSMFDLWLCREEGVWIEIIGNIHDNAKSYSSVEQEG